MIRFSAGADSEKTETGVEPVEIKNQKSRETGYPNGVRPVREVVFSVRGDLRGGICASDRRFLEKLNSAMSPVGF